MKKISALVSSEQILALGGLDAFDSGIYGMDEFERLNIFLLVRLFYGRTAKSIIQRIAQLT